MAALASYTSAYTNNFTSCFDDSTSITVNDSTSITEGTALRFTVDATKNASYGTVCLDSSNAKTRIYNGVSWLELESITTPTVGTSEYTTGYSMNSIVCDGVTSNSLINGLGGIACNRVTSNILRNGSEGTSKEILVYSYSPKQTKEIIKDYIKQVIKSNLLIKVKSTRQKLDQKISSQEIKARMTLRDLISEREYRRYLTNGFVMIHGLSNKWYQIFNDQRRIKVYNKGKLTDEICIHTDVNECPKTDHILNMMCLIQNDENLIWTKGVSNVYPKNSSSYTDAFNDYNFNTATDITYNISNKKLNLVETYKQLRVA